MLSVLIGCQCVHGDLSLFENVDSHDLLLGAYFDLVVTEVLDRNLGPVHTSHGGGDGSRFF
jgi:hypothetical protein